MHSQQCLNDGFSTFPCYCYDSLPINRYYIDGSSYHPCHYSCDGCTHGINKCDNCEDGFYRREGDDTNTICYSEYPGYYLEGNILKPCDTSCETCLGATNNDCIKCNNNYFFTEDTHSCIDVDNSNNYYLDGIIFRKCHPNCLKCSSSPTINSMKCISCQPSFYMTEDSQSCYQGEINNYYFNYTEEQYKKCHPNCLTCNTSYINSTHMNCLTCKNDYFITEDTNSCYNYIVENYYFDFEHRTLRRCHPKCLYCTGAPINNTYMNCLVCQQGYIITEDTNSCYYNIPIDNYYLDNINIIFRRCHHNCYLCSDAPESYYNQNCITCKNNDYYMTEDTHSCYRKAIDNYYFDTNMFRRCKKNCLLCYDIANEETFMNCIRCYKDYLTKDRNTCYNYIKNNVYDFYDLSGQNEEDIYYDLPMDAHFVQFTTSKYLKNNINSDKTSINLGKCEDMLKSAYNIPPNNALYYVIIDVAQEGLKIPKVEYDVYYLNSNNNFEKLDLSICKGQKIEVSIPVKVNENIDIFNSNSDYYNYICNLSTTIYDTDIHLNDRRKEYISNNLTLCEENCVLIDYNYMNEIAKCSCEIKLNFPPIEEVKFNNNLLKNNFKDINEISNLRVIKCYKMVFKKNNILSNYGFFIFSSIILVFLIFLLLYYFKLYRLFLEKTDIRIFPPKADKSLININSGEKKLYSENIDKKVEYDPISGKKTIKITINKKFKIRKNFHNTINIERNNENKKSIEIFSGINDIEMNDNSKNKIEVYNRNNENNENNNFINFNTNEDDNSDYNNYELNSLPYFDALRLDNRSFWQYYISLLKYNNIFLFAFFPNDDYNSRLIKILLYLFLFSLNLTINALFFTDETLHQIYKDKGSFNLIYQIPQILYSTIISIFILYLVKYFLLTEKTIERIKKADRKKIKNLLEKVKRLAKIIKIKFILFFIIIPIILIFFGFYVSCFCGVYKNTQTHLIKDALSSFIISHVYTFITCLLPSILRICSLKAKKKNNAYLYRISQMLENI